jgi:hypothetical protein
MGNRIDYAACLKYTVNFLVTSTFKMNLRVCFLTCFHVYEKAGCVTVTPGSDVGSR